MTLMELKRVVLKKSIEASPKGEMGYLDSKVICGFSIYMT